jgi:pyridoxamine 5'-phosphate oxidase
MDKLLSELLLCHDLPEALPQDPMPLFAAWFDEAAQSGRYDDPNAMALATATPDGIPSVRMVLCKSVESSPPALVFVSNYRSRKGGEIGSNPRAAAVFHWPHAKRQARIEGWVERVTEEESDRYFRSRSLIAQLGSTVSPQSEPISSRAVLLRSAVQAAGVAALRAGQGKALERPAHWGGYRIHVAVVELWTGRDGRLHDRARWTRVDDGPAPSWQATRLGP